MAEGSLVGDECSGWPGVSCTDGAVTRLDLSGMGLNGAIPAELGSLTQLTELVLGGNKLNGAIPRPAPHAEQAGSLRREGSSESTGCAGSYVRRSTHFKICKNPQQGNLSKKAFA